MTGVQTCALPIYNIDQNSVYFDYLGIVNDNKIIFNDDINLSVDELKNVNKTWLKRYMDH